MSTREKRSKWLVVERARQGLVRLLLLLLLQDSNHCCGGRRCLGDPLKVLRPHTILAAHSSLSVAMFVCLAAVPPLPRPVRVVDQLIIMSEKPRREIDISLMIAIPQTNAGG